MSRQKAYTAASESQRCPRMSKNDPFGFDISAAKDKKRKTKGRRGMSGAF